MVERKYRIEHALMMSNVYTLLLQQDMLEALGDEPVGPGHSFHIYAITRRPRIMLDAESVRFANNYVTGDFLLQRKAQVERLPFRIKNLMGTTDLRVQCPYPHSYYTVTNRSGEVVSAGKPALLARLDPQLWDHLSLEVLYIGQSYGVQGARQAPSRLRSHATLQAIYSKALQTSPDQEIWLVLWEFEGTVVMNFDPSEEGVQISRDEDVSRTVRVMTTAISEQQSINFTEAALIKYFQPEFNVRYRDSFPNPAHSTYSECYDIDLNSVVVQLNTENISARLWSQAIAQEWNHSITYFLHNSADRRDMFDFSHLRLKGSDAD
jgi:hypothetical protein